MCSQRVHFLIKKSDAAPTVPKFALSWTSSVHFLYPLLLLNTLCRKISKNGHYNAAVVPLCEAVLFHSLSARYHMYYFPALFSRPWSVWPLDFGFPSELEKKLPVNTLFMESLFRAMGTTLCQEMLRKLNSWEIKYSEFMDAIIAQTLACTFRRRQQHTEKKRCGDDNKKLIKASPSVSTPQDKHNPWEKQISVLSCVCCWKVCD